MPQDVPLLPDAHRKFIEDAGRSVRYLTYRSPEEIASFYRSAFAPMGMTEAAASKQAAVGDTSDLLFWGWPGGERLVVTIRSYLRRTKVKTYEIDVHLYGDD
jgi:hypothetical protein